MEHLIWNKQNAVIWEMARKLQGNGMQADVYLHAEDKEGSDFLNHHKKTSNISPRSEKSKRESIIFPAHKIILAAASPFLEKVLNEHYKEHRDACVDITIQNVMPEAIQCILDYLYCGSVNISSKIKKGVLEAANLLEIKDFTYYIQSSVKSFSKLKSTKLHENSIEPPSVATKTHQKRNKIKGIRDIYVDAMKVNEGEADKDIESVDLRVSRRNRKIKSKYSEEIYDINFPKIRILEKKKAHRSLNTVKEISDSKTKDLEASQESEKEAIPSLTKTTPLSSGKYQDELSHISLPSSVTIFPLKRSTSSTHDPKFTQSLTEERKEVEGQEGLFKFQVLLKECEDFPAYVCAVPHSSQGNQRKSTTEKNQPGESSVAINTWISKEINSGTTTFKSVCVKGGSQCDELKEDVEKEQQEPTSTEHNTLYSSVDKNQREVDCEPCGKKFSNHRNYKSHIQRVHSEANQMCKYCGKMFKRRCDLYMHERRHKQASLPCKYCGKIFKVAKDLQAHVQTHVGGKRFQCEHCNKELTSYRNLKNHIAKVHQKQRPFSCQECNKSYPKAYSLQVHMRSVHTGERPFKCNLCEKTFFTADVLKNHQAVHTGEKKYLCNVCGRPFSQYYNMITHQRIHTNHRPFLCLICQEDFKTKDGLLNHKWVHTDQKPLQCHQCHREFRIKDRYEKHMLKVHNEVINISDPIFELMDQMEEGNTSSPYCNIKVIGTAGEEGHPQNGAHEQMLDDELPEGAADDLSPVVHLVSNMTDQEVGSGEAVHAEFAYPLLTSATGLEGSSSSITLCNIAIPISCSEPAEPVDVCSLLNNENTVSGEALIESGSEVWGD